MLTDRTTYNLNVVLTWLSLSTGTHQPNIGTRTLSLLLIQLHEHHELQYA